MSRLGRRGACLIGAAATGSVLAALSWSAWAAGKLPSATVGRTPGPLQVVAPNLNNPRKIFVGPGGALFVAEAGAGGSDKCFGTGPAAICVGLSGTIARVAQGRAKPVVTGLVSWATALGDTAYGPAAVVVRGNKYDVLLQDTSIDAKGRNPLGPDGAVAGDLVSTAAGRVRPHVIANLAAFEAKENPDKGAGPGPRFGAPIIDSDPYALTPYRGGFAVVDASADDLLFVSSTGKVSVLAVFPTQREPLSSASARKMGAPPTMRSIIVRSVPTCVATGPDGALYVGELTGRPYDPGTARIWRYVPGHPLELYASGFTNISDIAFDGRNLLVLEIASRGLFGPASPGALIRLAPGGQRAVVLSDGLLYPTGVAVSRGWIYVSNNGIYPARGPGPHGELIRLRAP